MNGSAAVLTINLGAIAENWRRLQIQYGSVPCGAVVKANAYGLGVERVGPVLWQAGCRTFFVALTQEALTLRQVLPNADIHVLGGMFTGDIEPYITHRLTPVLNSLHDVQIWREVCSKHDAALPCDLQFDTGMARLGLDRQEADRLRDNPSLLAGMNIDIVLSHLAAADDPQHPLNLEQLDRFRGCIPLCQARRASFANSSGSFIGSDFHFDLGRPGVALYGANPEHGKPNPMSQVVSLQGKILQVRHVDRPETVGYGAAYKVTAPSRIATVGVGYADGYLRSMSDAGFGVIGGYRAPVVGRVSMDLITLDVTAVPESIANPGTMIDLIGPDHTVDAVAEAAGTIAYEILTALGQRYTRNYVNDVAQGSNT